MFYCGWDGGASKTEVCVVDEQGVVLGKANFGPINLNGSSFETAKSTIKNCIDYMNTLGGIENCAGLVIGLAGVSNQDAKGKIEKAVRECGYSSKLSIVGDQEIALAGAFSGAGAISIAGTGSICFGKDESGNAFRSGGYGYLIDDVGSGYAIGIEILKAVTREADGRGEKTCLTQAVYEKLNITQLCELISWLYAPQTEKKQIASLASLLPNAIEQGDIVAKNIANKSAIDLAALVISAFKKANLQQGKLALVGSIFKHFEVIKIKTEEIIQRELPRIEIVAPKHSPSQGAANIAREM